MTRIQKRRHDLLLTCKEVAQRSGLSVATVRNVEAGGPARISTRRKLLHALDLTVKDHLDYFEEGVAITGD